MAQNYQAEQHPQATGAARQIEKGWTVYDAVEHPIGTVTDVDTTRGVLIIDGRPVGFDAFEAPLDFVGRAGGNEVHLTKVLENVDTAAAGSIRLIDPPATPAPARAARVRGKARTETTAESTTPPTPFASSDVTFTPSRPTIPTIGPSGTGSEPLSRETLPQFSPPYANSAESSPNTAMTDWGDEDGTGTWSTKKIAMGALALGGLAAAGYVMRRRTRRRTRYERLMDAASGYAGFASDFASEVARQRNPAWWAALAAAALPVAYYAWPSSEPTYTEQAKTQAAGVSGALGGYLQALTDKMPAVTDRSVGWTDQMLRRLPSTDDFEMPSALMPSSWRSSSSGWQMPGDWSVKPDVAVPVGLLAVSALALYLARRAMTKPRTDARIRDVMTRKPRVIQPDATVADAAAMMRRLDVGALPVCDGSRLIGMLTDRDITTRSTADGRDPYLTPVRDVMSPGVAWATEDDLVEEAARIMREHQIRRLPIVDDRHSLVGVISLGDLATNVDADAETGDTLERISE